MTNIYKIEVWVRHSKKATKTFTNKQKAKKWLKDSGWKMVNDYGECCYYVYVNDKRLNIQEEIEQGWL